MVSKNNRHLQDQKLAQKRPHYGLRKLAVGGVASVLLGVTVYFGGNTPAVHADTGTSQSTTEAVDNDAKNSVETKTATVSNAKQNVGNNESGALQASLDQQSSTSQTTYHDDSVTATLDRSNYNPRDGQAVNLNMKYITKVGDKYTINIPKGAYNVSVVSLAGGVGQTTRQTNSDGSVTITNTFNAEGTYNQSITLTPLINIIQDIHLYTGGTTTKTIDILKNQQKLGQVSLSQTIIPTIDPRFNRTVPDPNAFGKLTSNVDYQWKLILNENPGINAATISHGGASVMIDHGTTVTIPVPDGFVLNAAESDNQSKYWKASQTGGAGSDIIFTSEKGNWLKSGSPIVLVGHFTTQLTDQDQVLTAKGSIKVVQDIGNNQTITATLAPFSETLMKKEDNHPHGDVLVGEVKGAYGGSEYPSGKIPLTNSSRTIKLWSYSFGNISPWSLQNVHVNVTVPDGMKVTNIQLPEAIHSGNITYTLHLYVDANHSDEVMTGNLDLNRQRNISLSGINGSLRSLDLKFDQLSIGQQTGAATWYQTSPGLRLMGYLDHHYDNGTAVQVGDELTSQLKITADDLNGTFQKSATQQVIAKPTKPAKFWSFGQETDKTPGKIGGDLMTQYGANVNNDDLVDPIFYYLLPSNTTFDEKYYLNQFNQRTNQGFKPKVTQFKTADGRTVVKVDYTGSGADWITSLSTDTLYLMNKPDVTNSSSNYKIFVVLPKGMKAQTSYGNSADYPQVNQADLQYVEGNQTAYQIGSGNWITQMVEGAQIVEQSQGNKNSDLVLAGESDNQGSAQMTYAGSVVNGTNTDLNDVVYVLNLPDTQDGQSGFNFQLTGPVTLIDPTTGQTISNAKVEYSNTRVTIAKNNVPDDGDFTAYDANTVKQVRSIRISIPTLAMGASIRVTMDGIDPTLATDVGKAGYLSSVVYTSDNKLKPFVVLPSDSSASRIAVTGKIMENAVLTFHDDTTNQDLKDVLVEHGKSGQLNATGENNSKIEFAGADDLVNELSKLHYQFAGVSGTGSNNAKDFNKVSYGNYDQDTAVTQNFVLHFTHQNTQTTGTAEAKLIVHYKYQNGKKAHDDKSATPLTFKKTITHDLVTGKDTVTWDQESQQFNPVFSPSIDGYEYSDLLINGVTAKPDSGTIERTVIYTPNNQGIVVRYIDDNTNEQLSEDSQYGPSDSKSGYTTAQRIKNYKEKHYELVSDDTNGVEIVYDHDDKKDQVYYVHLKHQVVPINDTKTVYETIHYVYADGTKDADDKHGTPVTFKRTGSHDNVTNADTWQAWTSDNDSFAAVSSPKIPGYTPDIATVATVTIKPTDQNVVKTVTYHPNDQKATLIFWDDTTNHAISGSALQATGKTADKIAFTDGQMTLAGLLNQHYLFVNVKNTTGGANLDVKIEAGATDPYGSIQFGNYDNADNVDQSFVIHLKHDKEPVTDTRKVSLTVHYQYADGLGDLSGKQAAPDKDDTITFSRTGTRDLVTKEIDYHAWNKDSATFDAFTSPTIIGYTPDHSVVDNVTVTPDSRNQTRTVIYSADPQLITVNYIDDVTGKTLNTKVLKGYSDLNSGYTTASKISDYQAQHYELVSDDTNGAELVFDHDDQTNQVYNVHLTHHLTPITETKTIHETIHYVYADGSKAKDDFQGIPVVFTRTGQRDDVTDENHWNHWKTINDQFVAVPSPTIAGYTPDQLIVNGITVTPDSVDQEFTVTYTAIPVASHQGSTGESLNGSNGKQVTSAAKRSEIESQNQETTSAQQLPQTGNEQRSAAIAGLTSLSLVGMLGLLKKRRHE